MENRRPSDDGASAEERTGTSAGGMAEADNRLPRRYGVYDKIKERVPLRTIDMIIVITSLLIILLLVYGILTANPQ